MRGTQNAGVESAPSREETKEGKGVRIAPLGLAQNPKKEFLIKRIIYILFL